MCGCNSIRFNPCSGLNFGNYPIIGSYPPQPFNYGRNPFNGFFDGLPGDMPAFTYQSGFAMMGETNHMLNSLFGVTT